MTSGKKSTQPAKAAGKRSNVTILTFHETTRELKKTAQQLNSSRAGARRIDATQMLTGKYKYADLLGTDDGSPFDARIALLESRQRRVMEDEASFSTDEEDDDILKLELSDVRNVRNHHERELMSAGEDFSGTGSRRDRKASL